MTKKKAYLLVILTICFFSNLTVVPINISNENENEKDLQPRASASYFASLDYNKSKSYIFDANEKDRAGWDFSTGLPQPVNITVMVMDGLEYENFNNSQDFTCYLESNGNYSSHSGIWMALTSGIWHIVFFHNDTYFNDTTALLTYNIDVYPFYYNPILDLDDDDDNSDETSSSDSLINILTNIVTVTIIIVLIVAGTLIAIVRIRNKKKSLERLPSPPLKKETLLEKRNP